MLAESKPQAITAVSSKSASKVLEQRYESLHRQAWHFMWQSYHVGSLAYHAT